MHGQVKLRGVVCVKVCKWLRHVCVVDSAIIHDNSKVRTCRRSMRLCVYNVVSGDTLTYHLPLLIGEADTPQIGTGHVEVWSDTATAVTWPVVGGCFKALVQLQYGANNVHFRYKSETLSMVLNYEDPKIPYFVRPVYIVCSDHDGSFQGPDDQDCSQQSALKRIALATQMVQTFTAEKMREHGFGRKTFQLERDENANPICHCFKTKLTMEETHSMTGYELWAYFARELMMSDLANKQKCKWHCFMSFTRYHPPDEGTPKTHSEILSHTKGHTALGGGGLALFGTGTLHTWAESLAGVVRCFTDTQKIDRNKLMDDSAYREYYWANYSTGLGASLHELGHTFDLAHTSSGIMARGFDDIYKVFIIGATTKTKEHANYSRESLPRTIMPKDLSGVTSNNNLESHARRYRDVCYGSPFKKKPSSGDVSSGYTPPPPLVVKVESAFRPLKPPSTLIFSMKNRDGSRTHQTISYDKGYENVTEIMLAADGKVLAKMSRRERRSSICSTTSSTSTQSPTATHPATLPNSPEEVNLELPVVEFLDDGAHWFRSSAVLLRFHKWFNKSNPGDPNKPPTISGSLLRCPAGFRLVELRSDPDGLVFHHWEFLHDPPTEFSLRMSRIRNLPTGSTIIAVLAEDSYGNLLKKKIKVVDIER